MRVVLFGGAGFIGSNLALSLNTLGYEVVVYDRPNYVRQQLFLKKGITYFEGDFLKGEDFNTVIQENDVIIHLVSTSVPNSSNENILIDASSNIIPSLKLIQACAEKKVRKIIFSSSGGTVYGLPEYLPIDEKHKTDPTCAYGVHKIAIEKYMQLANELYNIPINIIRISNPYGPGQVPFRGQGVIPTFIASIIMNKQVQIWGDGNSVRDYIYIEDLMEAIIHLIENSIDMDIFNIGSGIGENVNSILTTIEKRLGKKANVNYINNYITDVRSNVLDCTKIKKAINWKAKTTLESGIEKMIETWDADSQEFSLFKKR